MNEGARSAHALVREYRHYGTPRCDIEVSEAVDRVYEAGYGSDLDYIPNVTDADFYDVVTRISPDNFPVLAVEGMYRSGDVISFLFDFDLGHLIQNNERLVDEALRLELSPGEFTEIHAAAYRNISTSEMIRAMQLHVQLRRKDGRIPSVVEDIMSGSIRYEDAEYIGFNRFVRSTERYIVGDNAHQALRTAMTLRRSSMRHSHVYSLDDIKAAYESAPLDATPRGEDEPMNLKLAASRSARLNLLHHAGPEVALTVKHPVFIDGLDSGKGPLAKIASNPDALLYVDKLYGYAGCNKKSLPDANQVLLLQEHNVDPEMAMREFSMNPDVIRILALNDGTALALTDGWL